MEVIDVFKDIVRGDNPPASIANLILNGLQIALSLVSFFAIRYGLQYFKERDERFRLEMEDRREGRMKTRATDKMPINPYDAKEHKT